MSGSVVIIHKKEGTRLLREIDSGTPFWHGGNLYIKTNMTDANAFKLKDGRLCFFDLSLQIVPTTIEVHVND